MVMDGRMRSVWMLVGLAGCGAPAHIAKLSDANVVVAGGNGGGIVNRPHPIEGAPIASVLAPASRCLPSADLLALLGPPCSHESENPARAAQGDVDELGPGKPQRTREVRWYCDEHLDVRVVFEPCDLDGDNQPDGVTPVEIAVSTHRP
jgi:hypothetical protein